MIDLDRIVNETAAVQNNLQAREPTIDITDIPELYEKRNKIQAAHDEKRHFQREEGKKLAEIDDEERFEEKRQELREVSEEVDELAEEKEEIDRTLEERLLEIPNIIQDDVPRSQDESDAEIMGVYGTKPKRGFELQDHAELADKLGLIDFERATKLAGRGFPMYRGKGAQLEMGLLNYMVDHHLENGFELTLPPILNNTEALTNAGNLPKFADDLYTCQDEDLHVIPTAEVPLTSMFAGETVDVSDGPIRLAAYTPNFRKEAGGHGKRDKGLMRMHQFNKVETYALSKPDESEDVHMELLENAREILDDLGLHHRVAKLPSCDLAQQSSKTIDLEVWLPHAGTYSEVSSASNCTDYQARRANIRFEGENGPEYVHTLNCSGLATPRVMVSLLETYQDDQGNVRVPNGLQRYVGFDQIEA